MRDSQAIRFDNKNNIIAITYYSINHLKSADRFIEKAIEIQNKKVGEFFDPELASELSSYVTSTIFNVVAFLEANINEIIYDFADSNSITRGEIPEESKLIFKKLFELEIPIKNSFSTLEKYEFVLKILKDKSIDKGVRPYQDIISIINIRNLLVHYKPEWDNDTKSTKQKLEKSLKGKFELNSFFGKNEAYFPLRCLSADCAKWSLIYALKFVNEFYEKLELAPIYQHIVKTLKIHNYNK